MDVSPILDGLNQEQRNAVTATPGPALVLAGAGSGKTRVLVHRIAWLCNVEGVSPYGLLAVTFTNKAAAEMRSRVESLLEANLSGMWVGTFHGIAHRMLRAHWQAANLPQAFQILDSDDQHRLVKRIMKGLELDESKWPVKQAQWFINARKDEGLRASQIQDGGDLTTRQLLRVYIAYEAACERAGVVDFAELLLRSLELLRNNEDIITHYRNRFRHVLVDEFQDTNSIQYDWLKLLAGNNNPVFAVGDDDQSIYGWRGAKIENIFSFSKDYADTQTFRLEQNYRSTSTILSAANGLIDHNQGRLGKKLWTDGNEGSPVQLYAAYNEHDEARFVIERVKEWVNQQNRKYSEIAILYRSNVQSRVFEENLIAQQMPYRIYGGLRFFERAEIKDALAYLRLSSSRIADPAFERIVNHPPRGIGDRTLQVIRDYARAESVPLWEATNTIVSQGSLAARAQGALVQFITLIERLSDEIKDKELEEQVEQVIGLSGLQAHFEKDRSEKGQSRVENLHELIEAARGFRYESEDGEELTELDAFLSNAALESGEGQASKWEDCVQLMTLHTAKGLEFPLVFLVGMEEGLFPSSMSMDEPGRVEEERRLCYVGITRAREHLMLCFAESRRHYGNENYNPPSRFINEIPAELMVEVRPRARVTQTVHSPEPMPKVKRRIDDGEGGIRVGQRVSHKKFGEGVVMDQEGNGSSARVQVKFEGSGSKWLVLAYANLTVLG
ncbi:MAG: DNA helicase II [Gammaproteobacteria bacterium]